MAGQDTLSVADLAAEHPPVPSPAGPGHGHGHEVADLAQVDVDLGPPPVSGAC